MTGKSLRPTRKACQHRSYAQINEAPQYGYLWWLKSFSSRDQAYPAFYMSGNGSNKAVEFPSLDMAVVITSTNYNTPGMHEQADRLVTEFTLGALRLP